MESRPAQQPERYSTEVKDGFVVATITGESLKDSALVRLQEEIVAGNIEAERGLVIDCAGVNNDVSPEILKTLLFVWTQLQAENRSLRLCGVHGSLEGLLKQAGYHLLFELYDSPADALAGEGQVLSESATSAKRLIDSDGTMPWATTLIDRLSWFRLSPGLLMATAVAVVAVLAGASVTSFLFTGISSRKTVDTIWNNADKSTISGMLKITGDGKDSSRLVVAWPQKVVPFRKYSSQSLRAGNQSKNVSSARGPFHTRSDDDGRFRLEVTVPQFDTTYYVLVVYEGNLSTDDLVESDRALMSRYFRDPEKLVGGNLYQLTRHRISPGRSLVLRNEVRVEES